MLMVLAMTLFAGVVAVQAQEDDTPDKYITINGWLGELPNGDSEYYMEVENYGDEVTLPENTFKFEDEEFIGWVYQYKMYQPGDKVIAVEGGIAEAVFFEKGGKGILMINPELCVLSGIDFKAGEEDATYNLDSPYANFTSNEMIDAWCEGWNTKPDGSGDWIQPGEISFDENEILIVYAVWNYDLSKAYRVEFHQNFQKGIAQSSGNIYVKKGEALMAWIGYEYDGVEFTGWYDKEEGGKLIAEDGQKFIPQGDMILYAHWAEMYPVNISKPEDAYCFVTEFAAAGDKVEMVIFPAWDSSVTGVKVTGADGKEIELNNPEPTEYDFIMPEGEVTVSIETKKDVFDNKFKDVSTKDYFYNPVMWAVKNNITNGTSETAFSPNQTVTRAQIVTFLWRNAGSPEPEITDCPFTDVKESDYFYKAVLWAVESEITKGATDTTFNPDGKLTRGQAVTFIARNNYISDDNYTYAHSFVDVSESDFFNAAVAWASVNGVTSGTDKTHFSPNATCTRGQVVTFIFRTWAYGADLG